MAQVSQEHIQPLTVGFVTLLVVSLMGIAALNHFADH
jgi:undecaprenyl pyrophosphate phosphatase UppP